MAKSTTSTTVAATSPAGSSYLEWGAISGGAVVAIAISLVLIQFGAGVGLSADGVQPGSGAFLAAFAAALWLLWCALVSAGAGGYIAGRMRSRFGDASEHEVEMRDGIHGLVVWATSTILIGIVLAVLGALSALGGAAAATADGDVSASAQLFARNSGILFAFGTAAGSALSAGVAWWCATIGGGHRDEGVDVHTFVPGFLRRS